MGGKNLGKKFRSAVVKLYNAEKLFITNIFKRLPQGVIPQQENVEDEYIMEDSAHNSKKQRFEQRLSKANSQRVYDRDELKRRLQAKIHQLGSRAQNIAKSERKKKSKAMKREALEAKKRQFTSQSNPNLSRKNSNQAEGKSPANSNAAEKTPLQKKAVKKMNGDIVYSKFDFISDDKKPKEFSINKNATSAAKMLKAVAKKEGLIQKLKDEGKTSEAVTVADKQKWNNALQRAKGTKVRDDPDLLKKTIKKQEKIKKVKDKKWKERVELQEKFKNQKQAKRQTNLQKRKDEKTKKFKKVQRKKGRIA